ncbi:MAG: histone deacetylase [Flavobacteriaceae bacterium]|nr:histone deacetylase [Flavobacteriaceae bacterium]
MFKVAFHSLYHHPLPDTHRFPMEKYSLLPQQLIREGTLTEDNFFLPEKVSKETALLTHSEAYWQKLLTLSLSKQEARRIGFPQSRQLINRERTLVGGTVACANHALQHGCSMNIAGGTHHAYTDRGEGFCLLNDNAVAANSLLAKSLVEKILIVDLDVHQGNGTAEIFKEDSNVFTFSMHGRNNYPFHKEQSDLDIPLDKGMQDKEYLYLLQKGLDNILERFTPEFIFFQSGVDVIASDKLGQLAMTLNGCKKRDELVLKTAKQLKVPIVASMGGSYSPDINDIIEAHANTYRLAQEIFF